MKQHDSHYRPYIEGDRHDELTEGVPVASLVQANAGAERASNGQLQPGAKEIPAAGGKRRKGTTYLVHNVGSVPAKHRKRASAYRVAQTNELAVIVGGGHCGIGPSLLVKLAAQSAALAEMALEAGDFDAHRKLGEAARMHLVYARAMCAEDAKARKEAERDVLRARFRLPQNGVAK